LLNLDFERTSVYIIQRHPLKLQAGKRKLQLGAQMVARVIKTALAGFRIVPDSPLGGDDKLCIIAF